MRLAGTPSQINGANNDSIFQDLQYSDTPTQPLVPMHFTDTKAEPGGKHTYRVIAVNTVGLKSKPTSNSAAAHTISGRLRWTMARGL